jgi:hypothetical protein
MWQGNIKLSLTKAGCEVVNYIKPAPREHLYIRMVTSGFVLRNL